MNSPQIEAALKALAWQNWQYKFDSDSYFHRKDFPNKHVIVFANIIPEGTGLLFSIIYGYDSYGLDPPGPLHIPADMPAVEIFLAIIKILVEVENQVNRNDPT